MRANKKRSAEWIVIGLFLAFVVSFSSIQIYRAVIGSDWYNEKLTKKSFTAITEKLNEADNINYIQIDSEGEALFIHAVPSLLFDDISLKSFETVKDFEKQREIFNQTCIVVFYKDGTPTSFFITEDSEIYWGTIKVECPSLLSWYNEVINENQE